MRRTLVALAILIGAVACGVSVLSFVVFSALDSMCSNETLDELPSPDGSFKAISFTRDCGATTDFSTQVSILRPNSSLPDEGGNIFVAETGRAPSGPGGGPSVTLRWLSPTELAIAHHPDARLFKAVRQFTGVRVIYEESR